MLSIYPIPESATGRKIIEVEDSRQTLLEALKKVFDSIRLNGSNHVSTHG